MCPLLPCRTGSCSLGHGSCTSPRDIQLCSKGSLPFDKHSCPRRHLLRCVWPVGQYSLYRATAQEWGWGAPRPPLPLPATDLLHNPGQATSLHCASNANVLFKGKSNNTHFLDEGCEELTVTTGTLLGLSQPSPAHRDQYSPFLPLLSQRVTPHLPAEGV